MAPGNRNRREHGVSHHTETRGGFQPAKILFRIFQAVHHLMILRKAETDNEHPLFMKKVKELDSGYFKVAGAQDDPIFLADIKQGNREWRKFHIQSQIRHYERMIDFEKGALSACNLSKFEMSTHMNTAKLWARKNFRKKFNVAEFAKVEQIAQQYVSIPKVQTETRLEANATVRTQPTDTRSTPRVARKRRASTPSQDGKRQKDSESPRSTSLERQSVTSAPKTLQKDAWVTPRGNRKRRPESSPETSPTSNRDSKLRKGESTPARTVSPVLRDNTSPKAPHLDVDFGFGSRFRPLDTESNTDTPSGSKRKKGADASPTSPQTESKRGRQEHALNNESSPPLRPVRTSAKENGASRTSFSQNKHVPFQNKRPSNKIPFKTSEKVGCYMKLNCKIRGKKVIDHWDIPKIQKPILVLGTSNFRRIENVDRDDVQILSYGGMKFDHQLKMLDAFKFGPKSHFPGMKPTHVTIMAGLNDMDLAKCTNRSKISRTYSAAKKQFPESQISFCQVPMQKNMFTKPQCETKMTLIAKSKASAISTTSNAFRKYP